MTAQEKNILMFIFNGKRPYKFRRKFRLVLIWTCPMTEEIDEKVLIPRQSSNFSLWYYFL